MALMNICVAEPPVFCLRIREIVAS